MRRAMHADVWDKSTPFTRAFTLRPSGRNCNPAPDWVLSELMFLPVLLSGGVFFSDTGVFGGTLHEGAVWTDPKRGLSEEDDPEERQWLGARDLFHRVE